jgi:hypothetical protein
LDGRAAADELYAHGGDDASRAFTYPGLRPGACYAPSGLIVDAYAIADMQGHPEHY